jgi:hypothetical protein
MPSPFPGMDPYLELPRLWLDFHNSLATEIRSILNEQLEPKYAAWVTGEVDYQPEIRTTADEELVTVIEILSPSNKRAGHPDHQKYLRKRLALLRSSVHLVEIDLLRAGERPPLTIPVPAAPYYAVVSRAESRPTDDVWPIQLAEPLPPLPVPLLEPDPDTSLDLAAAFASVYDDGPYARVIDYQQPPPPPRLSPREQAWLAELLHWDRRPDQRGSPQ